MKKRIFIFINSQPKSGGSFQYAIAMLRNLLKGGIYA